MKNYLLNRELQELEYKVERHYALSVRKVEIETPQSNFIKKIWYGWEHHHVVPEYEMLTEQLPRIQSRIEEIKYELRQYLIQILQINLKHNSKNFTQFRGKKMRNHVIFLYQLNFSLFVSPMNRKTNTPNDLFRISCHERTIKRIEKITQKRFRHNGESLLIEILDKVGKKKK